MLSSKWKSSPETSKDITDTRGQVSKKFMMAIAKTGRRCHKTSKLVMTSAGQVAKNAGLINVEGTYSNRQNIVELNKNTFTKHS